MLQWQDEIARCTAPGTLKVLVYYKDREVLQQVASAAYENEAEAASAVSATKTSASPSAPASVPAPTAVSAFAGYDVVLTTYPVLEYEYRSVVNLSKCACKYCGKKMLPRSLVWHNKYFADPTQSAPKAEVNRSASRSGSKTASTKVRAAKIMRKATRRACVRKHQWPRLCAR